MKYILYLFFSFVLLNLYGQVPVGLAPNPTISSLGLKNIFLVAQLEIPEDKFTAEINIAELLTNAGIITVPSLNIVKHGGSLSLLASDSIITLLKEKERDTYMLVSVRGYDRTFRNNTRNFLTLQAELESSHLFPLYRNDIVSVTLEFLFYRDGIVVHNELLKLNNVSNKEGVMKKLAKKLPKLINKWKK